MTEDDTAYITPGLDLETRHPWLSRKCMAQYSTPNYAYGSFNHVPKHWHRAG